MPDPIHIKREPRRDGHNAGNGREVVAFARAIGRAPAPLPLFDEAA